MTKLPIVSEIDLNGKVVLMRVDHNVVKKGKIKDPFRLERSKKTISYVLENNGFPVLMSHFGRPRNKKTHEITIDGEENCGPVIEYIHQEWGYDVKYAEVDTENALNTGLKDITKAKGAIEEMKQGKADIVYLPNTRWFEGEENKGDVRKDFAKQLAFLADVFVYDAFGSWQPHASTFDVANHLKSYAGFLVEEEIKKLAEVTNPKKPFLAAIAGEKIDTKIGPILALHKKADYLIVGGIPGNALLCAKYDVSINEVSSEEVEIAKKIIEKDEAQNKILFLRYIIESEVKGEMKEGKFREIDVDSLEPGQKLNYVYDISEKSFDKDVKKVLQEAKTIFVNAVMGYDKAGYTEGTKALFDGISNNEKARVFFGGGDTLKALKKLTPELYEKALNDSRYFLFTGGGTILKAIEEGGPYELPTIKVLLENQG